MSRGILLDGQAVGREWSTISAPATIQVGDATISVTAGAALAACGEEEATINTGSTPTNWPLEREDAGSSVNEVTVYEPRARAGTPPKAEEPTAGEERTDDTIASRAKRRRKLRRMGMYVATAGIVVMAALSRLQGGKAAPAPRPEPLAAATNPVAVAPPPNAPVVQPRTAPAAPSTTVATRMGAPSPTASSTPPSGGRAAASPTSSASVRAGAVPSANPSLAGPAASASPDTASARAGTPASRAAASAKAKDMKTLEQRAVQAAASGAFLDAARLYEELARNYPDNPVYSEAARILATRGAEATSTEPRP
jgi:2-oxoglutarate dehydrogenase E2 component (dihydrolipoamide succinyltransferase)